MTTGKSLKPIIALCYDFDGTLAPGNMQEHNFIPELNIATPDFWNEVNSRSREHDADSILTYMYLMLEKARGTPDVKFTRQAFSDYGKKLQLFPGVKSWFDRINEYGKEYDASIEHYIISSGLREMIMGCPISEKVNKVYASSFTFDQNDVAIWPAVAVNYTTKTQFLFRINKGHHEVWDDSKINDYVPEDERPVPFGRMIFIGDGSTDVPCMRLVKDQGGYSIAVYGGQASDDKAQKLLADGRVHFVASADYSKNRRLDKQVKRVVQMMAAQAMVQRGQRNGGTKQISA